MKAENAVQRRRVPSITWNRRPRQESVARQRSRRQIWPANLVSGTIWCMCRNIKTLFNFEPPATDEEIRAASVQFVRKLAGFTTPSKANEQAFNQAIQDVFRVARTLLDSLRTTAPPRNREIEAAKARARAIERFG